MKSESHVDRFEHELAAGRVIGSQTADGAIRRGIDHEKVISIDHGALRIEPLIRPGWGRSGITYGPYRRENGLAFHSLILNGHNISRTSPIPEGFRSRLHRWVLGTEAEPALRRMIRWLRSGQKRHTWRRTLQWFLSGTRRFYWPTIDENLAVGWFPVEAPTEPLRQGCSLTVHAIVPEGGELWAAVAADSARTLRGLQNLPVYYTIVLREQGAAYYASSPASVPGMSTFPNLTLLAIDAFNSHASLYAGIHQSVLGEIGFRIDTRVYGTQIAGLPKLATWFGTAHAADRLIGTRSLDGSSAEIGGPWTVHHGRFSRTSRGLVSEAEENLATLSPASPTGLVHILIECGDNPVEGVSLIWRSTDERNFWCFEVGSGYGELALIEDGRWNRFPRCTGRHLSPNTVNSLQVYDDGERLRIYLNGNLAYGTTLHDKRLGMASGVGVCIAGPRSDVVLRSFEAHPREIRIADLVAFDGPQFGRGTQVIVADEFDGAPGDLQGHSTSVGKLPWERLIGIGVFELTGNGSAKVRASAQEPCPGRTAYTVTWSNPTFADIEVTITPAGKRRGTMEKGRAGLIFWQDAENYITFSAYVEDWPAMSIAAFFQQSGFEELFDAVWTNVGTRMHWGEPHVFRVVFDGMHFTAYINEEPVLYRALTDVYPKSNAFRINRVGIVANWEWGTDTGSTFENFVGRIRT